MTTTRIYTTGGLTVTHSSGDEGIYYDTPNEKIAYNAQIVRFSSSVYRTIYHAEPKKNEIYGGLNTGDAINMAQHSAGFTYTLPTSHKILWEDSLQPDSLIYSAHSIPQDNYTNLGGTANPMVIYGEPYYYIFFIAASDDDQDRALDENDYRHHLLVARTLDFVTFEIKTGMKSWDVWDGTQKPFPVTDVNGEIIQSNKPTYPYLSQGLIGSICYVGGVYYYFYTDFTPNGTFRLYVRTGTNLETLSLAIEVVNYDIPVGVIVRVAKAKGLNKFAVLYTGSRTNDAYDVCLQYTNNISIEDVGNLVLFDDGVKSKYFLGLELSPLNYSQISWMTDREGNLASPSQEDPQGYVRGGMLTWMSLNGGPYGTPYGGKLYRAGWNVSINTTNANGCIEDGTVKVCYTIK